MNVLLCVCAGSGCRAPSWCRWASTRSWTRRRCWRAGSPTSANPCRLPTTALCSTAARCRETPAARPATATERRRAHTRLLTHWRRRCCFTPRGPQRKKIVPVAQSGKETTLRSTGRNTHTRAHARSHTLSRI